MKRWYQNVTLKPRLFYFISSRGQSSYVSIRSSDDSDNDSSHEITASHPQGYSQTTKMNRYPRYTVVMALLALLGTFTFGVLVSKLFLLNVLSTAPLKISTKHSVQFAPESGYSLFLSFPFLGCTSLLLRAYCFCSAFNYNCF